MGVGDPDAFPWVSEVRENQATIRAVGSGTVSMEGGAQQSSGAPPSVPMGAVGTGGVPESAQYVSASPAGTGGVAGQTPQAGKP
ncbi:hypothetical protein KIPB_006757 [Kipferlia bialata]|uniref:Uncharacterized protein n=1 Tax=Kipferlia bialata TaxID=797122 RepID=A0A9K3CZ05_9EUKA|nr:hypothetical protein KIPB_006757 [Kipferlia bialata]|eukprot:g6757.t1